MGFAPTKPSERNDMGYALYSLYTMQVKKLNCSEGYVDYFASGYPDQYGNYSGFIGKLQRDVSDDL